MALSIGSLLADRYEITAPIATGGMGEVWQARDRVLDRVVAAKVLKSEYTGDPSFLARFRNEARHTAALSHQNIASVYDYGETTDDTGTQQLAFLVMEYVEGQPLVTILHDEGALPVDWTLHVLSQSADGLSAAHKAGVVHRDIKPGNLIVRPDGVVKLTDFGIAQARDAAPLTRTGMVVGTAQYLSPEQAQGMEVTAASDVYSLGVVAFECLSGARPFDGASQVAIALAHINRPPPPLPAHVPPAVRLLVERALAKDPGDRFPDGGAFAEAIRRVASGGTLAPAPVAGPVTTPTGAVAAAALANSATQVLSVTGPTAVVPPATGPATGPAGPMPPLQAPPEDDDRWPDPDDESQPDRRRRWAWVAAALLLVLLLGGGAMWLLGQGDRGPGDSTATNPTVSSNVSGIVVDPAAYIGEPAGDVEAELTGLGLTVVRQPADEGQLAGAGMALDAGDVADLAPTGSVPPDSTITLYVAEAAYVPGGTEPTDEQPTQTTAATTTTPPPSSTSPSTSSTSSTSTTTTTTTATTTTLPAEPPCSPPADCDGDGLPDEAPADGDAGAADPGGAG
ncbi:serine/threonine-protein kinase [Blastococcus sp. PRF04-17]|uniref:serine/threonine-protein kinase n=1 Tax=Blastococcus sp. PRF04-17 TaxID=2933797 RepID=UPI001FF6E5AA|nr:serine/threonine-protein kinase [Blastococcus sp. PRF04-17]UOY00538.1 serine/threonine protein kinase [Blastococcus sp. PRF04-17]